MFVQVDPPVDPWLLPHSCGEICNKQLQPECGHLCVSLCHPGPCPPCPKTTRVTCYCGRSQPMVKRCGVRGWSCGRVCRKVLSCELHTCEQRCHEGDCSACDQVVSQRCQCGKEARDRPCAAPEWQCSQLCCKLLPCGNHHCEKVQCCIKHWCLQDTTSMIMLHVCRCATQERVVTALGLVLGHVPVERQNTLYPALKIFQLAETLATRICLAGGTSV